MKDITPYLTFNGTCRQAMTFYKDILGGDLELMDFASSPMDDVPDEAKNNIMQIGRASCRERV